jgi:hypothetical protein
MEDNVQIQPNNPTLYLKLADLYASGGDSEKAAMFREAARMLQHDPRHAATTLAALHDAVDVAKPLAERPKGTP